MEDHNITNLDIEFKRYLYIMRPYLGQLVDQEAIQICNCWIQRLSSCSEHEKATRNKYVFQLCYQLTKGVLDEPFLKYPPEDDLTSIPENFSSEVSTEIEYVVVDADEPKTRILFNNDKPILSDTEYLSQDIDFDGDKRDESSNFDSKMSPRDESSVSATRKQKILCYTCPHIIRSYPNDSSGEVYEYRANNLILKLREIKKQNMLLHNELMALKEESRNKQEEDYVDDVILKIDHATSTYINKDYSATTLVSLKNKLQEVQELRNSLISTITNLRMQLDNFNSMKKQEIEDIEAKHKLEIIKIKMKIREETKQIYDDKLIELQRQQEATIQKMQLDTANEIQNISKAKDEVIYQKDITITQKDAEIEILKRQYEEQKVHLNSMLNKFIDKPDDDHVVKSQELEKRLIRMEKSKAKCVKTYETKLAYLQREKHLAECSLQLQLVRQRAQVVNEVADENQVELSSALDKLETKYKDIVANVQATAIQRRMQDQMALEAILQAACSAQPENSYCSTNHSQLSGFRKEPNQSFDTEFSGLLRQKFMNKCKSFGEDSVAPGYCLDSERLGELFEKVYIPQRDTGDGPLKK